MHCGYTGLVNWTSLLGREDYSVELVTTFCARQFSHIRGGNSKEYFDSFCLLYFLKMIWLYRDLIYQSIHGYQTSFMALCFGILNAYTLF